MHGSPGVTLIEALIIIAVIAILGAIAIPNYNTAQTRARVARTTAGMATLRAGLEAYRTDTGQFPETDWAQPVDRRGAGLHRLTTPVAYVGALPLSAFAEHRLGDSAEPRHAKAERTVLYTRAELCGAPLVAVEGDLNMNGVDDGFELDRMSYRYATSSDRGPLAVIPPGGVVPMFTPADLARGDWMLKSVGPNNIDDRTGDAGPFSGPHARLYNPANGTMSHGDIVVFRDPVDPGARR